MEFFDLFSIPETVMMFVNQYRGMSLNSAEDVAVYMTNYYLICLAVAAGLYLVCLVLGGFALSVMAKKAGIKNSWLGFLPFGNTYLAGKLAGEGYFFGKKIKRVGLYCVLAEVVFAALKTFTLVVMLIFSRRPEFFTIDAADNVWRQDTSNLVALFPNVRSLVTVYNVVYVISQIWWVVLLLLFFSLYIAFFRKYYARSPILFSVLCAVFPFRAFVLFAVRNNTPVDYEDYIRRKIEEEHRRYTSYHGNGAGGYGTGASGGYGSPNDSQGSPFSDFGGSSGGYGTGGGSSSDPFPEFGDNGGSNDDAK